MKITKEGFAVLERDTHLSRWIEESGRIDHNENVTKTICEKYIKPGDHVIDVGASLGDHTVPYARFVGPSGKVYAFEPQPESWECLQHNVRPYPWIETFNYALGYKADTGFLERCDNIGASRLGIGSQFTNEVEIKTLDDFEFDRVDFIKIDTEGYDLFVMRGAVKTIRKFRPKILFELHGNAYKFFGHRTEDYRMFIENMGYTASPEIDLRDGVMQDILLTPI